MFTSAVGVKPYGFLFGLPSQPLYRIKTPKLEQWVYSKQEKEEVLDKLKETKKVELQPYEGLGEMIDGKLVYVGNCGTGFSQDQLKMLLSLLEPMRGECPFGEIKVDKPVKFWTQPKVECEVRYLESSPDGKLRLPTFRKLRRNNV